MKFNKTFTSVLTAALCCATVTMAQHKTIEKHILLLSKEKTKAEVTETIEDSVYFSLRYVEKEVHKRTHVAFTANCHNGAHLYFGMPDLQADIVKTLATPKESDNDEKKKVLDFIRSEKTLDGVYAKLANYEDYTTHFFDDYEAYEAEAKKHPIDPSGPIVANTYKLSLAGDVVKLHDIWKWHEYVYDIKSGKRILASDLFTDLKYKAMNDTDTSLISNVTEITHKKIRFDLENGSHGSIEGTSDPRITDYAQSLMQADKGYSLDTTTNQFGDTTMHIVCDFHNFTDDIEIPLSIANCGNPTAVRDRILQVMFGQSGAGMERIVVDGVKNWPNNHQMKMAFFASDELISFAFDDESHLDNSRNTLIVFDRKSGKEINVSDLIKDKKGFTEFVNSHDTYAGGFLINKAAMTQNKKVKEKYGPEFRNHVHHRNICDFN